MLEGRKKEGILLAFVILLILISPTFAWNSDLLSWQKRVPINLTTPFNETNSNIFLNFTYDSDMQLDFDDLRFTYYGDTGANISYWIQEKYNSANVSLWLKLNYTYLNGSQIYMYYNNSAAGTGSSGLATAYYLFDDFNDNSINTSLYNSRGTKVAENNGIINITETSSAWSAIQTINVYTNYTFVVRVTSTSTGTGWQFSPQYSNSTTGGGSGTGFGIFFANPQYFLDDVNGLGDWDTSPISYSANSWQGVRIVQNGSTVRYYVNNTLIKIRSPSNWTSATIGLWSSNGGKYDDLFIGKPPRTDPTIGYGIEEKQLPGLTVYVFYGSGASATNWNITFRNSTNTTTNTSLNNPTIFNWTQIPNGTVNITISDASSALYYFDNLSTGYWFNDTNASTSISLILYEKPENPISLSVSPSSHVYVGSSVIISCSASEGSVNLTLGGIPISNPYTYSAPQGSYTTNCTTSETTSYRPSSDYEVITFGALTSCIENDTYAFVANITTATAITSINMTSFVSNHLVKSDLSDVYALGITSLGVNFSTGDYLFVVNNTGLTSFNLYFGNYALNHSYTNKTATGLKNISSYSQDNIYVVYNIRDEVNRTLLYPPNATLVGYISCSLGQNYFDIYPNDTQILVAVESYINKTVVTTFYSSSSYYSRTRYPDNQNAYYIDVYVVVGRVLDLTTFVMDDPAHYSDLLQIYKIIGGQDIIISEGYFDIGNSHSEYLMEDTDYLLRSKSGSGSYTFLGMASVVTAAGTIHIYPVSKNLYPSQTFIADNLIGTSYFLNSSANTTSLIVYYEDLTNQSANITITVYNSTGIFYNTTQTGTTTFTLVIPNATTNETYFVNYAIRHPQFGNSPVNLGMVVAKIRNTFDLGLSSTWYAIIAILIIFLALTTMIKPDQTLTGGLAVMTLSAFFVLIGWLPLSETQATFLFITMILGMAVAHKIGDKI